MTGALEGGSKGQGTWKTREKRTTITQEELQGVGMGRPGVPWASVSPAVAVFCCGPGTSAAQAMEREGRTHRIPVWLSPKNV